MTDKEKIEALEEKLNHATNLTAVLQMVAWDFAQEAADFNTQARLRRDAVIGLADAFERALA